VHKLAYVYHFGDFDPSGRAAALDIKRKLREFGALFNFVEAAVTPEQIAAMRLPTRPTKRSDTRAKRWFAAGKGNSVDLDAIPPNDLRALVVRSTSF
jgi:hypothetical protein